MRRTYARILYAGLWVALPYCHSALAADGAMKIPYLSGRPGLQTFAGHPGWLTVYTAKAKAFHARIDEHGVFTLPDEARGGTLIATFDQFEVIPFTVPDYAADGNFDIRIPVEYACVPAGYPEVWDSEYLRHNHHWFQTLVPECTQLYGITIFDGPKAVEWGNKFNATLHEDGPTGEVIFLKGCMGCGHHQGKHIDFLSGNHSDHSLARVGWRHGDLEVVPGKTYAMCAGGYNSHGGQHLPLPAYIRPDNGDGAPGECFKDDQPTGGDLCCIIFGNSHGQHVENHVRTEEWEIFIPPLPPTRNWGQSFTSHGKSLAGLAFWANNGSDRPVSCEVIIRQDYPGGDLPVRDAKPKIATAHASPVRPHIRYPDYPRRLEDYARYYELPADLFQVSYAPDEIPLEEGRMYYVELAFSEPVVLYADGDAYVQGYGHYEDLTTQRVRRGNSMHSARWTLVMDIVTYANPGGTPLDVTLSSAVPPPAGE
jgi:hypothetical protein